MTTVPRWVTTLFRTAGLFTLLAVIGGSMVAATESGFECSNWPGCDADALLPGGPVNALLYRNPWIEMAHRASAVLAGPLALASAIVATRLRGIHPLARILPWVAVAGAIVAGYVGRGIVLGETFPTWVIAADVGSALIALVAMTTATIALERTPTQWFATRPGLFAWAAVACLFCLHVASVFAAGPGSFTRVMGWPVWRLLEADVHGSLAAQVLRFVLAAAATVLLALTVRTARLSRPRETWLAVGFVAVSLILGALIAATGTDALGVPFALAAIGAFATMTLLAARLTLPTTQAAPSRGMNATTPASDAPGHPHP